MIIQCEKCETQFALDDSLIKKEGTKVKCSVCKHVFKVHPPQEAEVPEAVVQAPPEDQEEESHAPPPPPEPASEVAETEPEEEVLDFEGDFEEEEEPISHEAAPGEEEPPVSGVRDAKPGELDSFPGEMDDGEYYEEERFSRVAPASHRAEKSRSSGFLLTLLLILLLLVGIGAAVYYWAPGLIPDSFPFLQRTQPQDTVDKGNVRLKFDGVSGAFVESESSGSLFYIGGMVKNGYSTSRSFILLKGSILDDKGAVVKKKLAYAGNSFTRDEIRTTPLGELDAAMKNRFGNEKKNYQVPPGASIPFTIVFSDLPENVNELSVEAVSSLPGAS